MKKHVNLPMENEKFVNFTNSELMYRSMCEHRKRAHFHTIDSYGTAYCPYMDVSLKPDRWGILIEQIKKFFHVR